MTQRLENQTQNKALFLLAMLTQAGGSASLTPVGIKIEPKSLLLKLRGQIEANKPDFIRLLLGQDCPLCGAKIKMQGKSRVEEEKTATGALKRKWLTPRFCSNPACGKQYPDHEQPEFPILDRNGKEI